MSGRIASPEMLPTLPSRTATAWPSDWGGVCHGAHFGEGPVLAILAMLARKSALCVAPGGSAPPIPSVARRGSGGARSGRESRLADRTGKRVLRYRRPDKQVPDRSPRRRHLLDANRCFLSGADCQS